MSSWLDRRPPTGKDGNRGLALADAMFGTPLVDVNANVSAGAASCVGSFCLGNPLKLENCLVDSIQLLAQIANQHAKVNPVCHVATPWEARKHPRFAITTLRYLFPFALHILLPPPTKRGSIEAIE